MTAAIVEYDVVTAWGRGVDATWTGLMSGRPAFAPVKHFACEQFPCQIAALAPVDPTSSGRVWRLLEPLLTDIASQVPADCEVLLATTTGEIDRLERHVEHGLGPPDDSRPEFLLARIERQLGTQGRGRVVSAACASSTVALALAAENVERGRCRAALVVACDAISEFVFSGFASLRALDPDGARPFDRDRRGLTLGEAAAVALVMNETHARQTGRLVLGTIVGWGMSCDANHMTGPAYDGSGLARSIRSALGRADQTADGIGSICAHGTGTVFNDGMELRAFRSVFGDRRPPVYSIKGGVGHTLGAAGLVEAIVAVESMRRGSVPPTANLREPDADAVGYVSTEAVPQANGAVLSTNSGFGGINAALVLRSERGPGS